MSFAKYIQQTVDAHTAHRVKLVDESLWWVGMPRDTRFVAEENVLVKFLVNSRSEQLQNVINIFEREGLRSEIINVVLKGIGAI